MKIEVLGCSGGLGSGLRTSSFLIGDTILLDAGTGVGDLALERMADLQHIFVTHSHLDHVAGIPLLIDSVFDRIRRPIALHGRADTLKALQQHIFNWVIWPDFAQLPNADQPVLKYVVMEPGEQCLLEDLEIEMLPANHAVPAAGYRIASETRSIAFSGDTTTNDGFWQALNAHSSLDMLVVESAFPNRELELSRLSRHYCPSLLAADLQKLRHSPEVYITHLKPGAEQAIMAECREALPGVELMALRSGQILAL